jgi:hypothetical protein
MLENIEKRWLAFEYVSLRLFIAIKIGRGPGFHCPSTFDSHLWQLLCAKTSDRWAAADVMCLEFLTDPCFRGRKVPQKGTCATQSSVAAPQFTPIEPGLRAGRAQGCCDPVSSGHVL